MSEPQVAQLAAQLPGQPDLDGWRRMHKITPALKSWKIIVAFAIFFSQTQFDNIVSRADGSTVDARGDGFNPFLIFGWLIPVAVFGAALLLGSVWAVLSWHMTKYRLLDDAVQLHSGVVFRQQRQARLDRLQAVDVVQPLLGRIFGLSELKIEVAGGAGSQVKLSYLRDADAEAVRRALLASAAGLTYDRAEPAPDAPERRVYELSPDRLVKSILLSGAPVSVLVLTIGLVVAVVIFDLPGALAALLPALIGAAAATWAIFSRRFGFTVARSPDGIRLGHGLLERRAQTVPPGRVQALKVSQGLLWRLAGWWQVEMNVAGYAESGADSAAAENQLVPVATRDELAQILSLVLPDLGTSNPVGVMNAGLVGTTYAGGYTPAPPRTKWLDWISWTRNGYLSTDTALLMRSGALRRVLVLVPHAKMQSVGLAQGPLQRRFGVATVAVHSTPGPVSPTVRHLDEHVAAELVAQQTHRARAARSTAAPEQWMTRPGRTGSTAYYARYPTPEAAGGPAQPEPTRGPETAHEPEPTHSPEPG